MNFQPGSLAFCGAHVRKLSLRIYISIVCCLVTLPLYAQPATLDAVVQAKEAGNYAQAEQLIKKLLASAEGDAELWFQLGLVQRFQSQWRSAMQSQQTALALAPGNQDIVLEIARLQAAKGQIHEAMATAQQILQQQPKHSEALAFVAQHRHNLTQKPVYAKRWRADVGLEHSGFSDRSRPDWWQAFSQIGYRHSATTMTHVRLSGTERFNTTNKHIELGAHRRLSPRLAGALILGYTSSATFLPQWRVKGSMEYTASSNEGIGFTGFTLDAQHDRYSSLTTTALKPGVRLGLGAGADVHVQHIGIIDEHSVYKSGWSARANWGVAPLRTRFFAGIADAPETENAATINTRAAFIGGTYTWRPNWLLHAAFAREGREDSYTRYITSLAFSVIW